MYFLKNTSEFRQVFESEGLSEQAGAELGQAQLDHPAQLNLKTFFTANKLELKLRRRTKLLYSLQQNFISGTG